MQVEKNFRLFHITVRVHAFAIISLAALLFAESSVYCLPVLLGALVHEAGHILAIRCCGGQIDELRILPFGAEIRMYGVSGYVSEIKIAAAGPAANLLLGGILLLLFWAVPEQLILFSAFSSFFLAAVNLFPARGFDGGRILSCTVLAHFDYENALRFLRVTALFAPLLFAAFAAILIYSFSMNLSLIAICFYLFVSAYGNGDGSGSENGNLC